MQPHRRQPTRLPRPWDSPGKNTGVGCHFLLQCMKVKSESEVTQSCPTLSDPMDCSLPGSSARGIFPGKSTGVGCHCLLSHVQFFVTPWTIACQPPLSMGFSRQEHWSGLPWTEGHKSSLAFGQRHQLLASCVFPQGSSRHGHWLSTE